MSSWPDQQPASQGDWLEGGMGFLVESAFGKVGRVTDVERDPDSSRPVALVVNNGVRGRHRVLVPTDEVAAVLPGSGRIILNGGWAPSDD